jgi:predicted nuclease of predicted toxin-antitoxin system
MANLLSKALESPWPQSWSNWLRMNHGMHYCAVIRNWHATISELLWNTLGIPSYIRRSPPSMRRNRPCAFTSIRCLGWSWRDAGNDVVRASEVGQSRADDALILERAVKDRRTLVTIDNHFGDWVILPLSEHLGVIRVNVHPTSTKTLPSFCSRCWPIIRKTTFATSW